VPTLKVTTKNKWQSCCGAGRSVGNRISFANAGSLGLGVVEVKPPDEKAINEFKALYGGITQAVAVKSQLALGQ